MRSDFKGINSTLDAKLNAMNTALRNADTDGDNRLRVGHPTESAAIPPSATDYDGDGQGDNAFADATGDGFADEFDIFLNHYDRNRDGKVALSATLRAGTNNVGLTTEFTDDEDLAIQIDSANPDRNRNGVYGFIDANSNGRWDSGETINDREIVHGSYPDQVLGWRDGVIDRKDKYAKVRGRLVFRASQSQWTTDLGDTHNALQGSIIPPRDQSALRFGAGTSELPNISGATFDTARTGLINRADGQTFSQQVATQLGISSGLLATYTEVKSDPTS